MVVTLLFAALLNAPAANASAVIVENNSGLGIIKGIVRDDVGSPISDATVAIFRSGTSNLLKQVSSANDGTFLAKIVPGTYTVLAVAQGFNPMTLFGVEVGRSAELTYGIKLERTGSGNTLPEKRMDRNSSRWRIRAAQSQRSIYQNQPGDDPLKSDADDANDQLADALINPDERAGARKGQTVIGSYFASAKDGNYTGFNVAAFVPVSEFTEVTLIGQTGIGKNAPQHIEGRLKQRLNSAHQLRLNSSIGILGNKVSDDGAWVGQVSFQSTDEWKIREGVIFVFGIDYSRFIGGSSDSFTSPRLGLQFDVNAKTRLRAAFTPQTQERTWAQAIDLEGESVDFKDPIAVDDLVITAGKPQMNKSRRLEFGVERVLDNRSSIEANAFFDTTFGRGVSLQNLSYDPLGDDMGDFVADQQGNAQGIRVVYTRRLNSLFTTSAGYSFGKGQKLSPASVTDPAHIFESDFFQTFFGEFDADLRSGTSVRTIFRLSPQATVFAVDPFQGRLAIYDPGLSVLITQSLPTLGLPVHAEAIIDARNVFDFQSGLFGDDGSLRLNSQRPMVRGGIQVRF